MCGKGSGKWWSNEEVKKAIPGMKKSMCTNNPNTNKNMYKSVMNRAKKTVSKTMKEKAEKVLSELKIVLMECVDQ